MLSSMNASTFLTRCDSTPFLNTQKYFYEGSLLHIIYDSLFMWLQLDPETLVVGKAAIGNMLGGIGYFYGQSKIHFPKSPLVSYSSLAFLHSKNRFIELITMFNCRLKVRMISCYIGQLSYTQQFQAGPGFLGDFCGMKASINCWSG